MSTPRTAVTILTKDFRIEGEIDLMPGARLTDFMNETGKFMVVTNVKVLDHNGKEMLQGEFVNVLVSSIEIILPAENEL